MDIVLKQILKFRCGTVTLPKNFKILKINTQNPEQDLQLWYMVDNEEKETVELRYESYGTGELLPNHIKDFTYVDSYYQLERYKKVDYVYHLFVKTLGE